MKTQNRYHQPSQLVISKPISPVFKSNFHIPCHFFDFLPDMSFVLAGEFEILHCNLSASQFFGKPAEELLHSNFIKVIPEDLQPEFINVFQRAFKNGEYLSIETNFISAFNVETPVQLFISPFSNNHSGSSYCFVFARDISKQKERELDLVRFANVAEYTVNPLEITDVDGKIIYVNPAFERSSGYSREELIGKNPNIFSSHKHSKAFWKKMWDAIKQGKVWIGEVQNRKKSGQLFYTELLISPIVDDGGKVVGYFGLHSDKTEEKKLEQQLIHAQKMESIGLLAAGLAHEVGNPLTSISSLVQVIQRTSIDEFTNQKLELIKSQTNRISKIIRDLVNFSRRSTYELQSTDINKILKAAIEIARVSKKAKGIEIVENYSDKIPQLLLVPDQVQQVFLNILINAIDAMCIDSVSRRYFKSPAEIKVRSMVENNSVNVYIKDNGVGISEEALPRLFDPFYTTKKVGEGTGLGLWVSYNIVKSFQGEILVESDEGQGATFLVKFPINSDSN
jgi:PAS domain S-box-containing protein